MISAIVLAAGRGTRFGRCKQLVPVAGKALLGRVLDNLRASKIEDIVVVLGAHADEIRKEIAFDGVRVVMNPDHADGMSTSIQAGMRALPEDTEAAMIVLADQPFVSPRTLDLLVDEYTRVRPAALVPTYDNVRGNPVIAGRALFGEMMTIRGDVGCRAIFGGHDVAMMPVGDRGVTMDIDTMEDLEMTPYAVATVVRDERPTSAKPGDNAPQLVMDTEALDPICGMTVTIANARYSSEHDGRRFYFCGAHCQRTFDQDPHRYAHVA
jgi:molybdenum cofactor cytidylyltransferase